MATSASQFCKQRRCKTRLDHAANVQAMWKRQAGIPVIRMLKAGCAESKDARSAESMQPWQGRRGCTDLHKIWYSGILQPQPTLMNACIDDTEVLYRWQPVLPGNSHAELAGKHNTSLHLRHSSCDSFHSFMHIAADCQCRSL